MKKLTLLFMLLFMAIPARATIAFGTTGTCGTGTVSPVQATITTTTGHTSFASVTIKPTTASVSAVTDDGGSAYTFIAAMNQSTVTRVELWSTSAGGALASTFIKATSSGVTSMIVCGLDYSGVQAIGTHTTNTGLSTAPTVSLTTQDSNNFVVAAFTINGNPTITSTTGNLRNQIAQGTNTSNAVNDNTAASPSSVTNAISLNSSKSWTVVAVELRSTAAAAPKNMPPAVY